MINADLHCHSTVSDGTLTPEELAARAAANGVQMWSLTDHDEVGGLARAAKAAAEHGLIFIPGVEISVTWSAVTLHIVGLNVDYVNSPLERVWPACETDAPNVPWKCRANWKRLVLMACTKAP